MYKLILLFCAIIPTIYSQCSVKKAEPLLRRSIYEFSIDLLTRIGQETDYHFVTSPLSAWTLLSCASLGAADETLSEMKQVLHLHNRRCFNNKYLKIGKDVTTVIEPDVFLERSSVIFVDDKMSLSNKYKDRISKTQLSKIETVPFNNVEETAATINDFVSRATHDTIDDIVTPNDLENVVIVMIDALFFKGSWSNPFLDIDTEQSAFYNHKGNQIGDVNLMYKQDHFNITTIKQINAKVLELPYGQSKRFSMLLFLPLTGSLSTMIDNLKLISLASIRNLFVEKGPSDTIVQIPRFKITSDLSNLKELLMDMGIRAAFDSNLASFPIISDESLYISNFIQKADIEVTEEGTTASSVSAAEFSARMRAEEFHANKPFLFMIIDRENEIPIFTGAFSKPTMF